MSAAALQERVQAALFARLKQQVPGLKHTGRAFLNFDDIPQDKQPGMVVVGLSATTERDGHLPPKFHLKAMAVFFVRVPDAQRDGDPTPESKLFEMIAAAETALQAQGDEHGEHPSTTLGGLVTYCEMHDYQLHHGAGAKQAAASCVIDILAMPVPIP